MIDRSGRVPSARIQNFFDAAGVAHAPPERAEEDLNYPVPEAKQRSQRTEDIDRGNGY